MSERPRIEYVSPQEMRVEKPRIFDICPDIAERAGLFEESLRTKDFSSLESALSDQHLVNNMYICKGDNGKYLTLLYEGVEALVRETRGVGISSLKTAEELIDAIEQTRLPLCAWTMLNAVQFHTHQDRELKRLAGLMLELPEEVLGAFDRATVYNNMASLKNRYGEPSEGQQCNREALALLNALPIETPELTWMKLKLRHGLLHSRMSKKVYPDMEAQWLAILQEREALGDVHHVGRTYLDIGKCARQLFDKEKAIYYLTKSMELSEQSGYVSAAVQAAQELARVRESTGEAGRAKRVWVRGVSLGDYLGDDICEELSELREGKETGLRVPAMCLIGLGPDAYVVEKIAVDEEDLYTFPVVDQESKRGAEGEVRRSVAAILNHLLASVDRQKSMEEPIELSMKQTRVKMLCRSERRDTFGYQVQIPPSSSAAMLAATLDKQPIDGYIILSWQEIEQLRDKFDAGAQQLIAQESSINRP